MKKDLYFTQSELIHFRRSGCHVKITWKLITGERNENPQYDSFQLKIVFFWFSLLPEPVHPMPATQLSS